MNVDPLANETMQPYSFANNNPLRFTDPTGMAAEEWVNKDGKYFWDDRVVDQATAEKHHGEEASHIGVNKTFSTVVNGEKVDSVTLNEDGSVTKNGKTLSENSAETFTNEYGSTFQPRQTVGGYWQVTAGFAFFGGFGASFGKVYDAVGDSKYYFNIDGNIGYGAGVGLDGGIAVPTGSNQFLADDFGGNSGSYNAGATINGVDVNFHRGGSVEKNWSGGKKMNSSKFGDMDRGYQTKQGGFGRGAGGRVGGMYSYGTTKVF